MTVEIYPDTADKLKANAQAEGVSVAAYLERLMSEAESRRIQLAAFRQAIDERLASLNAGESANGEEVMARLIAEIGEHGAIPGAR
jgi:predicted transcriptional regulator